MAENATAKTDERKSGKGGSDKASKSFSEAEKAAMKERAGELKKQASRGTSKVKKDGEQDVLEKIAEMAKADRDMAERLHELVKETAPELSPKTWYGMPAYAKDGKVVCFFQAASKFDERYSTLGFSGTAKLDDGNMWPTAFALTTLTSADEKRIAALVKRAAS